MPRRSAVRRLPPALRAELDQRLIDSAFSDYHDHEVWLAEAGHRIGRSSLGRYGILLERELRAASVPVESTIDGKLRAGKLRIQKGLVVILLDPASRKTRTYSLPMSADAAWRRIEHALLQGD